MSASSLQIVLTTFGSLGDLHPYLALAIGLKERGHNPVMAAQESYRQKVEAEGIGFCAVGPDSLSIGDESSLMQKVMDRKAGPEFLIRQILMPSLREAYHTLSTVVRGADLLVTHPATLAAPLVAEKQREHLAWVSVALSPLSFFSIYDPPVLAPAPWLSRLRPFGPAAFRPLMWMAKRSVASWTRPWHELRKEIGLPPTPLHPMFEGQFSPDLTLALFSSVLALPQPDWPPNTQVTGFPFYDREKQGAGLDPALMAFLEAGEPPIVFTLGSSAVMDAGAFFLESRKAAANIGRRAILLVGRDPRNRSSVMVSDDVFICEYAPYSELMPRAAAVVHQGGVGTTGQALRAGCPMLVMPYGFDQPDNADRVVRLGVARSISRTAYTAERVVEELSMLLNRPSYAVRATEIGKIVQNEDGVGAACNVIEKFMSDRESNK